MSALPTTDPRTDHCELGTHVRFVGAGTSTDPGHRSDGTHAAIAGVGSPVRPAHIWIDAQSRSDGSDDSARHDHSRTDAHGTSAVAGNSQQPEAILPALPTRDAPRVADSLLLIYADALDDLERVRIATENRVRSLRQVKGLDGSPEADRMDAMVTGLRSLEHGAELELKRALRKHPLGPWIKATVGIGEKQGGRLLAAIGDPATRRTVSQLWAYCGYHVLSAGHSENGHQKNLAGGDPSSNPGQQGIGTHLGHAGVAPTRKRGQKANWNSDAKMRAFLVAESCMKKRHSPYRIVYDNGRAKYADALHPTECKRCGPAGKPAAAGSPLSDGHKHARALRLVAKAVLRDLWIEARRVQEIAE